MSEGIAGVRVDPLRQIRDDRGAVFQMLRADDPDFEAFGEIYFSIVRAGVVKGWHLHSRMTINYAVPVGRIRLVLYDERPDSPSGGAVQTITLGAEDYVRVRVPPGVWNAFRGEADGESLVANCATIPHDPAEIVRIAPDDPRIPYAWPRIGGKVIGG